MVKKIIFISLLFIVIRAEIYLELDNLDVTAGTVDIFYTSDESFGGFQFGFDGANIQNGYGGAAADADFTLESSLSTIIGFSFSGNSIPEGTGLLVSVSLEFTGDVLCISNPIISGPVGGILDVTTGACLGLPQFQFGLSNLDTENHFFNLQINNYAEIYSFQLEFSGVEISGLYGGMVEEYQFEININEETGVISGNMTDNPLPIGSNLFSSFLYSSLIGPEICINSIEILGYNEFVHNVNVINCIELPCGCMDENALDFNENAVCPGECNYDAFDFIQTTQQAFYNIENLTIDGVPIANTNFEIGAFNHDTVCVGSVIWPGHDTTLAVMGNDLLTPGSHLNMLPGEIPTFLAFNSVTQEFINIEIEECTNLLGQLSDCRWYNAGFNSINNLVNSVSVYTYEYNFDFGNNMISFPGYNPLIQNTTMLEPTSNAEVLMETINNQLNQDGNFIGIQFIIGQGIGLFNTGSFSEPTWSGNLNMVTAQSGYWINIGSNFSPSIEFESGIDRCEPYDISFGNNLLSYRVDDDINAETLEALGGEIFATDHFQFIIGQGVGLFNTQSANPNCEGSECWSGNLNNLIEGRGYWINITNPNFGEMENCDGFCWGFNECGEIENSLGLSKENSNDIDYSFEIPDELKFIQSSEQAFYLVKSILVNGNELDNGDIILAYNKDVLVGSVIWDGKYTPVPVMGRDISSETQGFCEIGDIPIFKVYRKSKGDIIELYGNFEGWNSLAIYYIESLIENSIEIPSEYILYPAYPNPFNPVTIIRYTLPNESKINLSIYNIEGQKLISIEDGVKEAGNYIIEWDANKYPSGIYFMKLITNDFIQTQKIILIK